MIDALTKTETSVLKIALSIKNKKDCVVSPVAMICEKQKSLSTGDVRIALESLDNRGLIENHSSDSGIVFFRVTAEGARYFDALEIGRRKESRKIWIDVIKSIVVVMITIILNLLIYVTGLADVIKGWLS